MLPAANPPPPGETAGYDHFAHPGHLEPSVSTFPTSSTSPRPRHCSTGAGVFSYMVSSSEAHQDDGNPSQVGWQILYNCVIKTPLTKFYSSSPALTTLGVIPLAPVPTNYINHADRSREHTPYRRKRHLEHCQAPLQAFVGAQLPNCTFNQLLSTI